MDETPTTMTELVHGLQVSAQEVLSELGVELYTTGSSSAWSSRFYIEAANGWRIPVDVFKRSYFVELSIQTGLRLRDGEDIWSFVQFEQELNASLPAGSVAIGREGSVRFSLVLFPAITGLTTGMMEHALRYLAEIVPSVLLLTHEAFGTLDWLERVIDPKSDYPVAAPNFRTLAVMTGLQPTSRYRGLQILASSAGMTEPNFHQDAISSARRRELKLAAGAESLSVTETRSSTYIYDASQSKFGFVCNLELYSQRLIDDQSLRFVVMQTKSKHPSAMKPISPKVREALMIFNSMVNDMRLPVTAVLETSAETETGFECIRFGTQNGWYDDAREEAKIFMTYARHLVLKVAQVASLVQFRDLAPVAAAERLDHELVQMYIPGMATFTTRTQKQ